MAIEVPGLGPCLPIRTARVAIMLALRALGLTAGARIGVPLDSLSGGLQGDQVCGVHSAVHRR